MQIWFSSCHAFFIVQDGLWFDLYTFLSLYPLPTGMSLPHSGIHENAFAVYLHLCVVFLLYKEVWGLPCLFIYNVTPPPKYFLEFPTFISFSFSTNKSTSHIFCLCIFKYSCLSKLNVSSTSEGISIFFHYCVPNFWHSNFHKVGGSQ